MFVWCFFCRPWLKFPCDESTLCDFNPAPYLNTTMHYRYLEVYLSVIYDFLGCLMWYVASRCWHGAESLVGCLLLQFRLSVYMLFLG